MEEAKEGEGVTKDCEKPVPIIGAQKEDDTVEVVVVREDDITGNCPSLA